MVPGLSKEALALSTEVMVADNRCSCVSQLPTNSEHRIMIQVSWMELPRWRQRSAREQDIEILRKLPTVTMDIAIAGQAVKDMLVRVAPLHQGEDLLLPAREDGNLAPLATLASDDPHHQLTVTAPVIDIAHTQIA